MPGGLKKYQQWILKSSEKLKIEKPSSVWERKWIFEVMYVRGDVHTCIPHLQIGSENFRAFAPWALTKYQNFS